MKRRRKEVETVRLIDANKFEVYSHTLTSLDFDAGVLSVLEKLDAAPTVDAVPVSELEKLRDYLYAEDLIFMRGLAELNKLIAKHGGTKAGKTPDKNIKP